MSHDRECPLRTRHVTLRTSRLIRSSCVFLTFSFLSFHFISLVLSSYLPSNYKRHHAQKHTSFKQSSSYHWLRPSQRTMLTSCCRHLCGLLLRLYPCISTRVFNHVCTVYCTETYEDIRGKQPLATTSQQGDQSHWGYLQLTNIIIFLFITRQKVRCLYC